MDATKIFTKLLGLHLPWFIERLAVDEKKQRVDIYVNHEAGIRVRCPVCARFYSLYDHAPERVYRHLDTMQMETYIHLRPPRVNCPQHGVRQVDSEFGENGSDMTFAFESHVLRVARECSIEATGRLLGLSWDRSWNTLKRAVDRGKLRKPLRLPKRIGVDEKAISKGHKYETIVYDLESGTVEYVCDDRDQKSLENYYQQFSEEELAGLESISMDMWDPYIAATKKMVPDAQRKIVFDRFHAMRYAVDAVDKVRKQEHQELYKLGDTTLKGTKYLWLWSKENIPEWRNEEFLSLKKRDLKICRAWAIKESLRHLWDYHYEKPMRKYFDRWYLWAIHSQLPPIVAAAKTLKNHIENITTYAKHHVTNAMGESINSKIEKVKRLACGFRNREHYKTAIYFHCGGLDLFPTPPVKRSLRFRPA